MCAWIPQKYFLHCGDRRSIAGDAQLLSIHLQLGKQQLKTAKTFQGEWHNINNRVKQICNDGNDGRGFRKKLSDLSAVSYRLVLSLGSM